MVVVVVVVAGGGCGGGWSLLVAVVVAVVPNGGCDPLGNTGRPGLTPPRTLSGAREHENAPYRRTEGLCCWRPEIAR